MKNPFRKHSGRLTTIASILLYPLSAGADPLAWLNPSKAAARLEQAENIGLLVAGVLAMGVVWFVLTLIRRHWKTVLTLSAIIAAIALLMIALGCTPVYGDEGVIAPYTSPTSQPADTSIIDGLGWILAGFVSVLWVFSWVIGKITRMANQLFGRGWNR